MTGVQADVERKRVVAVRVESKQVSEQTRMSSGRETADGTTNKQQEVRSEESLPEGISESMYHRSSLSAGRGAGCTLRLTYTFIMRSDSARLWFGGGRFVLSLATLLLPRSEPADTILYA
jgi:hypothetical protein